eukprot:CAMPEP_0183712652 /NCGR_PEP_ID=MMETSP0737-20130205/7725_1 /TAXON_ID=385413 /ORGANISM="Thalassiosira miniscula, Strain CCMP1093" /LENGTH=598 /DNA_ID=CAMNT_0025941307 /DNA_START=192 /DNA_END=1988 /DNA_ORIENTATION=-
MTGDNDDSAGSTQNVASTPSRAGADTSEDSKKQHSNGKDNKDDGQEKSESKPAQNGPKNNAKQRKAARWRQMNKQKKDKKRQKIEQEHESYKKKKNRSNHWGKKDPDEGPVPPHVGSFADETMQKLFNVDIDGPSKGGEKDKDATITDASDGTADAKADGTADAKIPKRKLGLLVSFLGSNYAGFQINSEKRTLQAEIELGLYRAGIISKMNFGHPKKYSWSNSARTDKGVHAAAQVCSLKGEMIFHNDIDESKMKEQLDAMRERVNEFLPEDIRVLDFERVTRMFCARTNRDKVRYQYMVPSYMLCSEEEVRKAFSLAEKEEEKDIKAKSDETNNMTPMEAAKIIEEEIDPEALAKARESLINYRVTSEQMERFKSGLKLFEGTHSFHNYTRRIGADNASATRYILSFAPLDPIFVPGKVNDDGTKQPETQWIPLQVVGQSFLLNQIRKMVSAAVDFARGVASEEQIEESFSKQCRMKINVAPAQGLFLDRSYFELYNKHKIKNGHKHGDSRDRETLDWVEVEGEEMPAAVRRIEEFKNDKIIPHIVQEEAAEGNFLKYVYAQNVLHKDKIYSLIDEVDKSNNNANEDDIEGAAGED